MSLFYKGSVVNAWFFQFYSFSQNYRFSKIMDNNSNATADISGIFVQAQLAMGCLMLPIIVCGFFGNIFCILIYSRRSMSTFINTLLIGLNASDLLLLFAGLTVFMPLTFLQSYHHLYIYQFLPMWAIFYDCNLKYNQCLPF